VPRAVPRTAGRPHEVVVRVAGEAELRGVGLAEADRAGVGEFGDDGVVDRWHEVGHDRGAERRPDTGGVVQVLDRGRDAEQRGQVAAAAQQPLGTSGIGQRLFGGHRDERAEAGVQRGDARQ
jgi:hypothetical protein